MRNELKDVVSELPANKKAELYYQDRKRYLKLSMEGEHEKALKVLKHNDKFYREHYHEDPDAFHKAHHKFISWSHDYTHFQQFQQMIAEAIQDKDTFKWFLNVMILIETLLKVHPGSKTDELLRNPIYVVELIKEKLLTGIAEYDLIIPQLEQTVEDDEYFKKYDYFQDVDPIGYKNLTWDEYFKARCKISANNGPILPTE